MHRRVLLNVLILCRNGRVTSHVTRRGSVHMACLSYFVRRGCDVLEGRHVVGCLSAMTRLLHCLVIAIVRGKVLILFLCSPTAIVVLVVASVVWCVMAIVFLRWEHVLA